MISQRAQKRLARVLKRLLEESADLVAQADGSWAICAQNGVTSRLLHLEVQGALSQGLLRLRDNKHACASDEAQLWLLRRADGDPEAAFAAQHRTLQNVNLVDAEGVLFTAQKNTSESPLAGLMRRRGTGPKTFLSPSEFVAGERLRQDYYRSSLAQKLCADWFAPARGRTPCGPRNAVLDAADSKIAAKDRFMAALAALGPGLDDLVFGLLIREISLETLEKARRWPRRSAKVVLKLALVRLARHYGLSA